VTTNTNIRFWLLTLGFLLNSAYLWRTGLSPQDGEPRGYFDRALRIFGAVFMSAIVIYFIGYGLGLFGLISK
jgi:hypothetical protein